MKNKILELRKNGKTYNEIVKILGCSKSTVSYHCNRNKNYIFYIDRLDEEIQRKIIKIRQDGIRQNDIYKMLKHKVTKEDIKLICRKNNLSHLDRMNDKDIKKIREIYKKVGTYKEVGNLLDISVYTVKKYTKGLEKYKKKGVITKSESVINWRKRTKKKLVDYKGGKCEKCGYDKYPEVLEFHHKNKHEKDFTISGKSWSFERLKKEVDKCILVCSNCHKEIHIKEKMDL